MFDPIHTVALLVLGLFLAFVRRWFPYSDSFWLNEFPDTICIIFLASLALLLLVLAVTFIY